MEVGRRFHGLRTLFHFHLFISCAFDVKMKREMQKYLSYVIYRCYYGKYVNTNY